MKILLIDNYDSFVHNLKQILLNLNVEVDVVRNDQINTAGIENYDGIVYSPGPGIPEHAGQMKSIIQQFHKTKPMLGVCLGMQAIAEVFQCKLRLLKNPLHGLATLIENDESLLFKNIPKAFTVGRYHSWVIDENIIPNNVEVIATDQEQIMAIKVNEYPVYGVQFHPESIMTEHGQILVQNFLNQIKSR
ncbi:MAG: anthranilate synthase/aminodeoxychorismate synthase-like glutamine amidotransferase [Crocinitomix sp.]|jgi:anthranilate synthase/aminodeoxychorismate synthase-like glutamine amidotransferase